MEKRNCLPLTYFLPMNLNDAEKQAALFRRFAEHGGRHVVFSSEIVSAMFGDLSVGKKTEKVLREFGLDFVDAHATFGDYDDPGLPLEEYRKLIVMRAKCYLRMCRMFHVATITFHTGNTRNNLFGNFTIHDYYQALIRSMEELLPEAENCQVTIALENQWTPLNHSRHLVNAVQYFHSPRLGLCLDVGHANLMIHGQDSPEKSAVPTIWNELGVPVEWDTEVMEKMRPYIVNCHLHDNAGYRDTHDLPGSGNVDWDRALRILKNAPLLQCIQSESILPEGEDGIGALCSCYTKLLSGMTTAVFT